MSTPDVETWVNRLLDRHAGSLSRPELLKAIRALSARYVEHRSALPRRSPVDSAGKRAAFATFYAPLHYVTMREVLRALGNPAAPRSLTDLGCGTGVAAAAWAGAGSGVDVKAVDRDSWAVAEARWNLKTLGVAGRVRRGDLVRTAADLAARRTHTRPARNRPVGVVAGWSVNEIPGTALPGLLESMDAMMARGATVLVVEPIARTATPWWSEWADTFQHHGGRIDEWRFDTPLPPALDDLSRAAGFRRRELSARSLFRSATGSRGSKDAC